MSHISVIGSGFSGLSAACFAAHKGHTVSVYEKNSMPGGRARYYRAQGFTFDMGPSWYWMPDVFEDFFKAFGKSVPDFYKLVKLDPGFQVFFGKGSQLIIPADLNALYPLFEEIEKGSADKLKKFLQEAEFKYNVGMRDLAYKPALSLMEYANFKVLKGISRTHIFKSMRSHVRSYFKDERLVALMEFPVLFLGAMPQHIPALYSLMNFAALSQGTFYPMGGMYKISEAMQQLAVSLGVNIITSCEVSQVNVAGKKVTGINTSLGNFSSDAIIASADYHHVEQKLLPEKYRNYSEDYWHKKTLAPSCLIFYVGVNKKINKLIHHNLFFDTSFETHAGEIYDKPQWPSDPLFYVCCPSKTDDSVAPQGMENLFILMPVATDLVDTPATREHYFKMLVGRIEKECGESFTENIIYKESYCLNDFVKDYNSYKGNAYGLANTLRQTAILKPSVRNKKLSNLFYTGQLTVPGPGVPPALISGQIAARLASEYLKAIR